MSNRFCPREVELWESIASGAWAMNPDSDLRAHVERCVSCSELAIVAQGLRSERAAAHIEPAPPAAAIVWWRAQMRARQESARKAGQPINVVEGLAIASGAGLLLGLTGSVATWMREPVRSLTGWWSARVSSPPQLPALDFTNPWILLPLILLALTACAAPMVLYALRDE